MYKTTSISEQLLALADRIGFGRIYTDEKADNGIVILWHGGNSTP